MTYKKGVELIDCIFAATAKGYETDAMKLSISRIGRCFERGEIGSRTFERLNNYIFDKTAFAKSIR